MQREILAALEELEDGQVLLIGSGWPSARRAAHRLAIEGIMELAMITRQGKKMLALRPANRVVE